MRLALFAVSFLGVACSDYDLVGHDKSDGDGASDGAGDGDDNPDGETDLGDCSIDEWDVEEIGFTDVCPEAPEGGFTPVVEWEYGSSGDGCLSLPAVGDLDGDGMPEIVVNMTDLFGGPGSLTVLRGDGSGMLWEDDSALMAYGSPPSIGDVDGDGSPDIVVVREYESALFGSGDYTAAMYDASGNEIWESEHFVDHEFDWATAPVLADMDHDGRVEVVVGRAILHDDGSTRGVGEHGRGSYGITEMFGLHVSEASVPAVTDLDLDGLDEVVTGAAVYDADGNTIWHDSAMDDGYVGIVDLDGDPEGEFIAVSYNTVRAVDTDGTVLWGPLTIPSANILSVPTIGDIDLDGQPEVLVAGGDSLLALNTEDGSELWSVAVRDESGATGASIFDFEGDGLPDVVYIDEIEMMALDGADGALKFYSSDHASNTMMDYPVIADVDADDQAEIVVCHNGHSSAMSVYGDLDESWMPARKVWNQHAYGITNVGDDLSIPTTQVPSFQDTNTWHSAVPTTGEATAIDLEGDVLDVCLDECASDRVFVTVRVRNPSYEVLPAGLSFALYADFGGSLVALQTGVTEDDIVPGTAGASQLLEVAATALFGADALWLSVDDDGTGAGVISECSEENNRVVETGPFCE